MFRKYTAIAITMMLTSCASLSAAEQADCCADQGIHPTPGFICSANQACDATCRGEYATRMHDISTESLFAATCGDCDATSGTIFLENPAVGTTVYPPALSAMQLAQRSSASQAPSTGEDYTTQYASMQEQKMLNLLNQDRKNNGLAPLRHDAELSRIARIKSADMRDNRYFAHESPTYGNVRAMLRKFGYAFSGAGENIAHHANVDKAQAAFMSSQGHRRNILSAAWTKVGVGIVEDANGFIYATQIFAR